MKEVKITCDNCGKDITTTGAMPTYRLHLSAEPLPHTGNAVFAVMVYPPIENDKYFCDVKCLKEFFKSFKI